jgi:putative membrane protein
MSWLVSRRGVQGPFRFLVGVPFGFILYSVVFSIYHAPDFYDVMMRSHGMHIAMHLVLMATAVLMWWPVVGGAVAQRPLPAPMKMLYLFLLGIPMMAVAAFITFAHVPLYSWYALAPRFMGIAALEDQRLGGLIMWVPGGLFYWVVMSIVFFRWSARESRHDVDPLLTGAARS